MHSSSNNGSALRRKSVRHIAIVLVAAVALVATACSGTDSADGEVVVKTDGMSTEELTEFAASALRATFDKKSQIDMTIEISMLSMFGAFADGDTDINAMLEAEGLSEDDLTMTMSAVMLVDGANFDARTSMDASFFGEASTESGEFRQLFVDGVMYQEIPNVDTGSATGSGQWMAIDTGDMGQGIDIAAYQNQTFENLEGVTDHGEVEIDGENLRRLTASMRGNELLGEQIAQQNELSSSMGVEVPERMVAIQQYIAEHTVTNFEIFITPEGQVRMMNTAVSIDAEEQYAKCSMFLSVGGTRASMKFSEFPEGVTIEAPPVDEIFDMQGMIDDAIDGVDPEQIQAGIDGMMGDQMDAMMDRMLANCPGA